MKNLFIVFIAVFCFASCSVVQNPEKIRNSIPIYENQPEVVNGTYFNLPYKYSYNFKSLLEILKINDHNVDSLRLALLGPKQLKVISYKPLGADTTFVKGKLRNGTFQIKNRNFFFGVPYLFFFNTEEKIRLSVGVLDELIVQHYQYNYSQLFGNVSEEIITDYYHYSKTLEVIP